MKRNFKRRFMTGVAAIAMVAPLVLGGLNNNVHAANTSAATHEENMIHNGSLQNGMVGAGNPTANNTSYNPNANSNNGNNTVSTNSSGNSGKLAAIKAQIQAQEGLMQNNLAQARKKYQSLSKAQQKAQLKTMNAQLQQQQQPIQQKITTLQKKYTQTMTPKQRKQAQEQQKAQQQKFMKQIQAQMKANQKKEQKKMLKTAQTLFVIQGKKVYTLRTDIVKNKNGQEQIQPIPGINKKYYSSVKTFSKKQLKEVRRAKAMALNARSLRGKAARTRAMKRANNLFLRYARVANMPTAKQQKAEEKKAAKQQKKSQSTRKTSHKARTERTARSKRVTRKNRQRKSTTFQKKGITVLRSEYRHGTHKNAVKKSGFASGPTLDGVHTLFNRYQPNDKRAIIPRNYRIYKVNPNHRNGNATTWLVGHKTNQANKINSMKRDYYYNTSYHGWINIGQQKQNRNQSPSARLNK